MEFNEQFYQNLFKLMSSSNKDATGELLQIVKDVSAYYVANGITELWQNPAPPTDLTVPVPVPSAASEIPSSSAAAAAFGTTNRLSETIVPVYSYRKDIVGAESSSDISQYVLKPQPYNESPAVAAYSTTLNDSFSRQIDPKISSSSNNNEISSDLDSSIEVFGDIDADNNSGTGTESLRIVPNFEGNEQGDYTVEELYSKSVKPEETAGIFSFGIRPDVIVSHHHQESSNQFYEPFDDSGGSSAKFRKLNDDSSPLLSLPAANVQKIPPQPSAEESAGFNKLPVVGKSAGPSSPAGNFDVGGLSCAVCKQLTFTLGNYLLECHECHLMYHQKCYDPVIPQNYINDPRLLWYCNVCSKKQKKVTQKSASTTTSSKVTKEITLKEKQKQTAAIAGTLKSTVEHHKDRSATIPLQATVSSVSSSNSFNAQKPLTGVASLAADFLAKHKNKTAPPTTAKIAPGSAGASFGTSAAATPTSGVAFAGGGGGLVGLGKLAATQRSSSSSGTATAAAAAAPSSAPTIFPTLAAKTLNVAGPSSSGTTVIGTSLSAASTSSGASSPSKPAVVKQPPLISSTQAAERRLQLMKKKAISKSFIK